MNITKLAGIIPDNIIQALTPDFLQKAGIDGPRRLSHFLGQCMEETGNFTVFMEKLNYSAMGLAKTWPGRYAVDPKAINKQPNPLALKLQHDPVAIANNCYCNRNGNGDEASGDGWKYRGRGPIQLTGLSAYQGFQDWLNEGSAAPVDIVHNPDIVAKDINIGLLSAAWIFQVKNLWPVCDLGVDLDDVTKVTKKVNGGLINLETRFSHTQQIFQALAA